MRQALHILIILATLFGLNDRACAQLTLASPLSADHTHADCHHHSHGEKETQCFHNTDPHSSCESSIPLKNKSHSTDCTDCSCHHHSCGIASFAIPAKHDKINLLVPLTGFLRFQSHTVGLPEEIYFSEDKPPLI